MIDARMIFVSYAVVFDMSRKTPQKKGGNKRHYYGGPQLSRQNLFTHGKINFATAKSVSPRQSQFRHDQINFTTAKSFSFTAK